MSGIIAIAGLILVGYLATLVFKYKLTKRTEKENVIKSNVTDSTSTKLD